MAQPPVRPVPNSQPLLKTPGEVQVEPPPQPPPSALGPQPGADDDKHQRLIHEVGSLLIQCGLPEACLDPQTRPQFGYTKKNFAKLLHRFRQLDSPVKLQRFLLIGVNYGFFSEIRTALPRQFYDYLEFLKTPQGQQAWHQVMTYEKLSRKVPTALTPQEFMWLKMFQIQRTDPNDRLSEVRRNREATIRELEHQLRIERKRMKEELEAVKKEFSPACFFSDLPKPEFQRRCWASYLAKCGSDNVVPADLTEQSLLSAVNTFASEVRNRHVIDFLSREDHKVELQQWIKRKIAKFDAVQDRRASKRLKSLLGSVDLTGGGVRTEPLLEDSGREAANQQATDIFDAVVVDYPSEIGEGSQQV